MRALLIAFVVCLTALTFYVAVRQTSQSADTIGAQQAALEAQIQSGALESMNLQEVDLALEAEINTLTQSLQTLTSERDGLVDALAQTQVDFDAKTSELGAVSGQNTALQQQADAATTQIAELTDRLSEGVPNDTNEQMTLLQRQLASRDTTLTDLRASLTALTANLEDRDQAADALASQVSSFDTEIETLTASIAERNTLISSLETQLVDAGTSGQEVDAQLTALTTELDAREQAADEMASQISSLEATIASRDASIAERDVAIAALQSDASDPVVATPQDDQQQEKTVTPTETDTAGVQLVASADSIAQQCVAQATVILTEAPITFEDETATFAGGSIATLERLGSIANDCQYEDLILEIGAHTDSRGAEVKNQTLSEERAQAVLDYMAQLGIATVEMRAAGFGETQPIQSNGSIAGRAANSRITFDWQQR